MAVITISREAGGGGESIAELVATKLGFKFFNKDLVKYIAILSDKTEEEVKKFDEAINANLRSSISGFFEKKGVFSNPFGDLLNFDKKTEEEDEYKEAVSYFDTYSEVEPAFNSQRFMKMTEIIMKNIAATSNCVIVGRGSQCILENEPNTLHLRLTAPLESRVARYMAKDESLNKSKATEQLKLMEKNRSEYIKHYYKKDINDPSIYHSIINLGKFSTEEAVDFIVSCAKSHLKF
jgi:cytidylate kinase